MIRYYITLLAIVPIFLFACGDSEKDTTPVTVFDITFEPTQLTFTSDVGEKEILIKANRYYTISSNQSWCTITPTVGYADETTTIKVNVTTNNTTSERTATLTFSRGADKKEYIIKQEAGKEVNYVPSGYTLVWQDEFNDPRTNEGKVVLPNSTEWFYETAAPGWVNNELQTYIAGHRGTDTCAMIYDGSLKIIAKKIGKEILSARVNTNKSWQYGYFEARLKLPGGKGTWPAFWMMPKNFTAWPDDGEIDIMEYVGYQKDVTHSAIHTKSYNHSINTQKEAEKAVADLETDFHVYALEWTADKITTYIDGKVVFTFENDKKGNKDTWPFNAPFYLKLNLAWGGDWGGAQGIDESALPATYEIDYVRVYQKE